MVKLLTKNVNGSYLVGV